MSLKNPDPNCNTCKGKGTWIGGLCPCTFDFPFKSFKHEKTGIGTHSTIFYLRRNSTDLHTC